MTGIMGLRDLRERLAGLRLSGEEALRGESLHLSHLRRIFSPLEIGPGHQTNRPLAVLAFTNRSGSTYLGQLLASTPDLYGFREDLNHTTVAQRAFEHAIPTFAGYLRHVVSLGETPGATFGVKASAEQLRLIHMTGIDQCFERVNVIRIRRRDRVAQAVSLWMAWQTMQWTSRQDMRITHLSYNYTELRRYLQNVQEAEAALDLALSVLPYQVFSLDYETLCESPGPTVSALRQELGLGPGETAATSWAERQGSDEKSSFVAQFREDLARDWALADL